MYICHIKYNFLIRGFYLFLIVVFLRGFSLSGKQFVRIENNYNNSLSTAKVYQTVPNLLASHVSLST